MANITESAAAGQAARIAAPAAGHSGPRIDLTTLMGAVGAFLVIGLAMVLGGSPGAFVDIPALLIVLAGSFLVTAISFTWEEVRQAQHLMMRTVVYHVDEPEDAAREVLHLASLARQNGILSLQKSLPRTRQRPFLHRAVGFAIDGTSAEDMERTMAGELHATAQRHLRSSGILRRAGEVAPAMGLIGTLVGLVQMLGNLEEPSTIGPAMAVALLTTFYGAVLANMVFLPLAKKLERNSEMEAQVNEIYAAGAISICRKENPRRLEMLLNTILPPARRINLFD
jgi:chemotaxis protein MotA